MEPPDEPAEPAARAGVVMRVTGKMGASPGRHGQRIPECITASGKGLCKNERKGSVESCAGYPMLCGC